MVDVSLSALGGAGWQFLDNNGKILSGGRLYTFGAGGSTPVATYTDHTGNTSNGVYVQLDSAGRPPSQIWQATGTNVKFDLRSSTGASIRTYDYIPAVLPTGYGPSFDALASTVDPSGASLIGNLGGGTVQDAIFVKGRQTPVPGSKAQINWLRDDPLSPLEDQAGIWPAGTCVWDHGINKVFELGDGAGAAPSATLFVRAENAGSAGDIVAGVFAAAATSAGKTVFGMNILALAEADNCKIVGLEIDVEPSASVATVGAGSAGLYINAFNKQIPGAAIQIGGVGGGNFNNGIIMAGINVNGTCLALDSGGSADSLINTASGTYSGTAVTLGSGVSRGIMWTDGSDEVFSYFDGTNQLEVLPPSGAWVWRDSTNTNNVASVDNGGNFDVSGVYRVDGVQVVSNRDTGWTPMTGSPDKSTAYNTGTVSTAQLAGRVAFLQAALTAHGLIGA